MKRNYAFAIVSLICLASLTSCKKKWTCECTINYNGISISQSATDTEKRSKKDAKALCESGSGSYNYTGFSATYDCHLK